MPEAFDGRRYVVDTSAWAPRIRREAAAAWSEAMPAGQLLITPVVQLELLYAARDEAEFAEFEQRLVAMPQAPLDRSVARTALGAMRELVAKGPLHHRVPITDALVSAAAAERNVGVLHYDEHFDRLASVLGFESRWIVPSGSV